MMTVLLWLSEEWLANSQKNFLPIIPGLTHSVSTMLVEWGVNHVGYSVNDYRLHV
jgi:hypothetical protein